MKPKRWRMLIEVGFIVFLFYTNLLMGEFERSGLGQRKGIFWALSDIFTTSNLAIAAVGAVIGYLVIELLRGRISK
jgi:NhaP-type Na+/H+ or K+/H+ antiporter